MVEKSSIKYIILFLCMSKIPQNIINFDLMLHVRLD